MSCQNIKIETNCGSCGYCTFFYTDIGSKIMWRGL